MAWFTTTYLGNSIDEYLYFFAVVIAAVLVGKVVTWTTKRFIRVFADKTETKADDLIVDLLEGPVLFTILLVALYFGQRLLTMTEWFADVYGKILSILFMLNIAWYLMRFIGGLMQHYIQPLTEKTDTDLDDHMLPIMKKLINFVIVAIVAIMAIDKLGYNVSSLLAGLGLGGLAFALAAQDLVGNLFGGIAILIDKPFKIGDRIKVEGVDGFVREIGLRTTRVETFGGTMMVLPNSKVVNSVAENITAEKQRRMTFTLGVEYGTSVAKLEEAKRLVVSNIKKVPGLDHKEFSVTFKEFGGSSLDINVIYWITKKGLEEYWGVQDRLLLGIKKDFEKAGIEFAFPTQTVHVKK